MVISIASVILFFAIVSLILATIGYPDLTRFKFFPGGMALWAVSLFVDVVFR